jgi:tRNA(Ile)-lysidine synthase
MTHAAPQSPSLAFTVARTLEPYRHHRRWWIACSGGVDSVVLLHAIIALTREAPGVWPPLAVVHVNHQLNPQAPGWAQQVAALCVAWSVPCTIKTIAVGDTAGHGVEAAARVQRYAAFEAVVGTGELLLQAHHRDDQIETLLLRMLRGAGLAGLRSIPQTRALGRGQLMRPLLECRRTDIVKYAQQHALHWVEDDSNADPSYDRNFLRQRVLPLIAERWPAYRYTLGRVATQAVEAEALLQEIAAGDWRAVAADDGGVLIEPLLQLSPLRRRQVLRFWLAQQQLPTPSRAQLENIVAASLAATDAEPCVRWPGAEVRRFQSRLYAMPPLAVTFVDFHLAWLPCTPLELPNGYGLLAATPTTGAGLRADLDYVVRNRRGGERCHPSARTHSQALKKLLQEAGLAPWWRDGIPLIYCGEVLAAVGDLWICKGFEAAAAEPGWQPIWHRPTSK